MNAVVSNRDEIERRGGLVYSDADFVVVACEHCGVQYLYDEETLTLYFDPADLTVRALNSVGEECPPCVGCSRRSWDFKQDSLAPEVIAKGRWSWAL